MNKRIKFIAALLVCLSMLSVLLCTAMAEGEDIFSVLEYKNFYSAAFNLDGSGEEPVHTRTEFSLKADGSFEGYYSSVREDEKAADYPAGTFYTCNFSGKLGDFKRIDENSFSLTVISLEYEQAQEERISAEGVLYTCCPPEGISEGSVLVFYSGAEKLPEKFAGAAVIELGTGFVCVSENDNSLFCEQTMMIPF